VRKRLAIGALIAMAVLATPPLVVWAPGGQRVA